VIVFCRQQSGATCASARGDDARVGMAERQGLGPEEAAEFLGEGRAHHLLVAVGVAGGERRQFWRARVTDRGSGAPARSSTHGAPRRSRPSCGRPATRTGMWER
jgi:hypothetical protein